MKIFGSGQVNISWAKKSMGSRKRFFPDIESGSDCLQGFVYLITHNNYSSYNYYNYHNGANNDYNSYNYYSYNYNHNYNNNSSYYLW